MNIPSRQEVKDELQSIANSAGYTGSTVDFIISIMATGYYETLLRSIGIMREANSETAANINSLISLAIKRMYSAFRGYNPQLILKGTSTRLSTLKRGDKVYTGEHFNLYVYKDVTLYPNQEAVIPLIASSEYVYLQKQNQSDRFYVEFRADNLSEDIDLYIQTNQTEFLNNNIGNLIVPTKIFRLFNSEGGVLDMTIQDFGVRYYRYVKDDANFTISGFKYIDNPDQDIDDLINEAMADVRSGNDPNATLDMMIDIPNFTGRSIDYKRDTNGYDSDGTPIVTKIYRSVPRESKEELRINYNSQIDSIYLIRSNSDLLDTFKQAFSNKIYQVNILQASTQDQLDEGIREHFLANRTPQSEELKYPLCVFFYIPKDEANLIIGGEMNSYRSAVKYYYLYDNLYACRGIEKKYKVYITVRTNDTTTLHTDVNSILSEYNNQFGINAKMSELLTKVAKLQEVNELVSVKLYNDKGVYVDAQEVTCNPYEYLSLESELITE